MNDIDDVAYDWQAMNYITKTLETFRGEHLPEHLGHRPARHTRGSRQRLDPVRRREQRMDRHDRRHPRHRLRGRVLMIGYVYNDGGRAAANYRGDTGDCVVRAIAIAGDYDYRHVYDAMGEAMREAGWARSGNAYALARGRTRTRGQPHARDVQHQVIQEFGFVKAPFVRGPRPTYTEAHERHGICIAKTTKHVAALRDGALQDTFDGRVYDYGAEYDGAGNYVRRLAGERKAMTIWVWE